MTGRVKLRRVDAGLYETPDGRYGVVRIESADEWDEITSDGWAIVKGSAKDGEEMLGHHYRTKAETVAALARMLGDEDGRGP